MRGVWVDLFPFSRYWIWLSFGGCFSPSVSMWFRWGWLNLWVLGSAHNPVLARNLILLPQWTRAIRQFLDFFLKNYWEREALFPLRLLASYKDYASGAFMYHPWARLGKELPYHQGKQQIGRVKVGKRSIQGPNVSSWIQLHLKPYLHLDFE